MKIKSIKKIESNSKKYDIQTLKNKNFFANGILVHNSFIGRFVYKNKVYFFTRGMIETMAENDEQKEYFNWTRKIAEEKYPNILDPGYMAGGTCLFELVGPGNQIVTYYHNWDLIMTGYIKHSRLGRVVNNIGETGTDPICYYGHDFLVNYNSEFEFAKPVQKLYAFGETLEEKIASINKLYENTDDEGSVIQFEKENSIGERIVIGRIKAKTENYRNLLKIISNCSYDNVKTLIESNLDEFKAWPVFEAFLKGQGSARYPEELLGQYQQLHWDYWAHRDRCEKFAKRTEQKVAQILDKNKINFSFGENWEYILDKKARAEFAKAATKEKYSSTLFAALDGKLDVSKIMNDILKTPKDSESALKEY